MRVGLNLLYLIPDIVGGTETYASGLLEALANVASDVEFVAFVNRESKNWPLPKAFTRVVCPVTAIHRVQRYFFEQACLPRLLEQYSIDLIHSLGYVAPLFPPCPSVVTIHDLNYLFFGKQMRWHRSLSLAFFVRKSAWRAKQIITISKFSRDLIAREYQVPISKVTVTNLASNRWQHHTTDETQWSLVLRRLGIADDYCVAFGNEGYNKNIPTLIEAFASAHKRYRLTCKLVIIGHIDAQDVRRISATVDLDNICVAGYLDTPTLHLVLSHAKFLVAPSLYEGFGLPVLEAMELGLPVVCSNAASLPEVAGSAALYFDPHSAEEMASRIAQMSIDPVLRASFAQAGFENLKRFSWKETARQTLAVYQAALAGEQASDIR